MKIAFIMGSYTLSASHGVLSQCFSWMQGLEALGHEVTLVNPWNPVDWCSFDVIHAFMYSDYVADYMQALSRKNKHIVFSPILDPDFSIRSMKMMAHWGCSKLKLTNRYYKIRAVKNDIALFLSRSDFESQYLEQGWGVAKEKIHKVPLSISWENVNSNVPRENFCFHVSFLADDRKNVKRLIDAAEKYQFKLKLAGKLRNDEEKRKVDSWLKGTHYTEYLGFLSKEDLFLNYTKAKVFALPSTNEGVGIVALEAAAMGCDIVLTNIGGPKEYYNGMAELVNPYNIDDIGNAVVGLLSKKTMQPKLSQYIKEHYSMQNVSNLLIEGYKKIIND